MSNITINNFSNMSLKVSKSDYWDFKLSKDNDFHSTNLHDGEKLYTESLITYIDFNNPNCIGEEGVIYSDGKYKWDKATNKGISLINIGLTGVDNGKITIDESNYKSIIKDSVLTIESNDLRLQLTRVGGNTGVYKYPVEIVDGGDNRMGNIARLRGGFYQGFFKSGKNYQVLPLYPETEITYEFLLKPEYNVQVEDNILNGIKGYDNNGIFFYLGLRAENKFLYEYANFNDRFSEKPEGGIIYPINNLKTKRGVDPSNKNYAEINTDNKYLLFNRTKSGFTASNFEEVEYWDNDASWNDEGSWVKYMEMYSLQVDKDVDEPNKYINYNRTADGLRATSSDETSTMPDDSDNEILNDTYLNQIAFRIKDDGKIGYRAIVHDCDNPNKYSISEEYSDKIVISANWHLITVRMVRVSTGGNFKLQFYVNGELFLISKELPELKLRELSVHSDLQEGVPYNISLGGGTQGLIDMIGFNDKYKTQYIFPIEKYFAGSFIGEISHFKIYNDKLSYEKILNNNMYFKNKLFYLTGRKTH